MFLGTETRTSVRSTYLARTQGESIEARIQTKGKLRKYLELVPSHEKFIGCFFTCKKTPGHLHSPFLEVSSNSLRPMPHLTHGAQDGDTHDPHLAAPHLWPCWGGKPLPSMALEPHSPQKNDQKWPKITEHVVNRPFSDRLKSEHISSMANKHGSLPRHSSLALFGVMRKPVPSSFPTQSRSRKAPWR
jgi:hypothetical protein